MRNKGDYKMSSESLRTPGAMKCSHTWKKLGDSEREDGSFMMVCEKCCISKTVQHTVEKVRDIRPLLME